MKIESDCKSEKIFEKKIWFQFFYVERNFESKKEETK